jgi:anti-sigma B factor antagonist
MALLTFTRRVGPALVFDLHGTLDDSHADKLTATVDEAIQAGERLLIFDLAKVTYISSAGLSVFLVAYRHLQGSGHVRFAALQPAVRQLFNITGLGLRVEIYDSVEDALVGPRP